MSVCDNGERERLRKEKEKEEKRGKNQRGNIPFNTQSLLGSITKLSRLGGKSKKSWVVWRSEE